MRYSAIRTCDINNGPGLRVTLWVQGCSIRCKGCHNKELQDPLGGLPFTRDSANKILKNLENQDLSILGGEPLDTYNRSEICKLLKLVKSTYPNKHIMVWTGHYIEELLGEEVLNYIDVLVDSPFLLTKYDKRINYRGSTNQRIIDVPETIRTNKVVLKSDYYESEYDLREGGMANV